MLRIVILLIFCLFVCSPISAQALADGSRSKPKPPSSLYDGYREDRVHAYIPVSDIPDRYPIHVSGFVMPLADVLVTSVYGMRCKKMHRGIDLALEVGDTIASAFEGYVRKTGYDYGGYGRFMVVRHLNGLETVYGHLQTCLLDEGTEVKSGQSIALGGNTGRSTGPHLHFEILFMGQAIDPRRIIDFAEKKVHQPTFYYTKNNRIVPNKRPDQKKEIQCHRVQKGDTLLSIAKKYAVTVDELCRYNHLERNSKLRKGQIIRYS